MKYLEKTDIENLLKTQLKTIGNNVKGLRISKGWSASDLAFYSKTTEKTITYIENNPIRDQYVNATMKTIVKIAEALDIAPEELLKNK